jgi:putative thioredoxin
MIEVSVENFELEVMQASVDTPVLVDFWAPWCAPCKVIGPLLEQLEEDYQGRFKLVKINSDDEQQISQAFGIKSLPTCILLKQGRPVDGFMGALPLGQIKAFLDKHLPSVEELTALEDAQEAQALMEEGDAQAALVKLQEALAINPANDDARFDCVKLLITEGELDTAQEVLAPALGQIPVALRFESLKHWLACLQFVQTDPQGAWSPAQFVTHLEANKRDFAARLAFARCLVAAGEMVPAMDELLEIIMRDKTWSEEIARKLYVAILELMTPPPAKDAKTSTDTTAGGIALTTQVSLNEDPRLELISKYRRRLSSALN